MIGVYITVTLQLGGIHSLIVLVFYAHITKSSCSTEFLLLVDKQQLKYVKEIKLLTHFM